ncbi:MAG: PKD domain-containing protein [Natrialbaceae archaeon]|nr:PKD domain-containing protein [Natrialbaceae archaeon]
MTFNASDSTGNISTFAWDLYGNGTVDASGETISHQYNSTGDYQVTLTVGDAFNNTNSTTSTVPVTLVEANYTHSPVSPIVNQSISFNASSSRPNISSYEWDLTNDGTTHATGAEVNHTFNTVGTKSVTVTVTDSDGNQDNQTRTVTVQSANIQPLFSVEQTHPVTNRTITFNAQNSLAAGNISSFEWNVTGNGSVDLVGDRVNHTYFKPNTYTVTLTVTDEFDNSDSLSRTLSVPAVHAEYSYEPTKQLVDKPVRFNASSARGEISEYAWDL